MSLNSLNSNSKSSCSHRRYIPGRPKVHVQRLTRRSNLLKGAKAGKLKRLEARNKKLYLMNKIIVEQNEQLRRKAMVLLQEKKALLSQYHNL